MTATVTKLHASPAERMHALFGGAQAFGFDPETLKLSPDGKLRPGKTFAWKNKKPTTALWEQHLRGKIAIGVQASKDDGPASFGSIDIDEYSADTAKIVAQIYRDELPLIPCRSKSGGLHLFIFASEPVPRDLIERALRSLAARLGISLNKIGGRGNEIIVGSNIWMPHSGERFAAVKKTMASMTVGEFLAAAEEMLKAPAQLEAMPAVRPEHLNGVIAPNAGGTAYAAKQLRRYCADLGTLKDSEGRNGLLNKALYEMGRMVGAGWIDRAQVEQELRQVADRIGMDQQKTRDILSRREGPLTKGTRASPPAIAPMYAPIIIRVADVPPAEVDWLWKGRIARGKLTVIGGHPGINKSTLTMDMAARVTKGGPWPCGEGTAPKGNVLLLTSEDDVGDTVHPRLAAAGADVRMVHVLRGMKEEDSGTRRGFDLVSDVAALDAAVCELGDVALIVIDPVTAYMGRPGKLDSYRATDVRAVFEPLQDMAARCGAAVIAINHLTKGGSAEALMRFLGSVGMVASSRAAYLVVRDKEHAERRLFLPAKNNLGDDHTGFAFHLVQKSTGYEKPPYAVAIEWEPEKVTVTADEALAADVGDTDGRKSESAETAKKLIIEMLRDGPRPAIEFERRARDLAISEKSMRTARKALGVLTSKQGKGGWEWFMPGQAQRPLPIDDRAEGAGP